MNSLPMYPSNLTLLVHSLDHNRRHWVLLLERQRQLPQELQVLEEKGACLVLVIGKLVTPC